MFLLPLETFAKPPNVSTTELKHRAPSYRSKEGRNSPAPKMDEEIRAHLEHERWREAFDLVLKHYQTKVFHLAVSILGNREQAEDASQEIFLRIWRALPGYRGMASISTWIFSIARNASLTALKRASARRTISLEEPGMLAAAERREPERPTPD